MKTRYLTYDIAEKNIYKKLYALLDDLGAEKVTESTYEIKSNENLEMLSGKISKTISNSDRVFIITHNNEDGMFHNRIKPE